MEAIFKGIDAGKMLVPLGVSYYTFKLIHYVIEVRRGNIVKHSFQSFACYLFLFPIFTAGPIERYDHFLENIDRTWKLDSVVYGLTRIMHGFIKKFFIGDILIHHFFGTMNNDLLIQNLREISTPTLWGYLLLMNLYLYMDFSAYSDLAIGTSRLFGIKIMENFNFPIFAHNLQEFWRRWHMSLSGWCQNYIYMPVLGLSRNPHLALYATFIGMGIWHAGTLGRIGWGAYHATGITLYMTWVRYKKKRRIKPVKQWTLASIPGVIMTYIYVSGSMIFLIAGDETFNMARTFKILAKVFFINI
jgi:alginate O-acetyltransferase complex protein AlgI